MNKRKILILLSLLTSCFAFQTEAVEQAAVKCRYSDDGLVDAIDQYQNGNLYRRDRMYWTQVSGQPQLISEVLENGDGLAIKCTTYAYNGQGKLVEETLHGNISGACTAPLIILPSGFPKQNGIESYTTVYRYHSEHTHLIEQKIEENGMVTTYAYHPKTKKCIAELYGNSKKLLSRVFYQYDENDFLSKTTIDDGQGITEDDLTDVTSRQIEEVIFSPLGEPLVSSHQYLDLSTGTDKVLDKIVYSYDASGRLVQQDFYDCDGALRYYIHQNYNEKGNLAATVDSRGEVALPSDKGPQKRYNETNQLEVHIDRFGNETEYRYDAFGRLTQTLFPAVLDESEAPLRPLIIHQYDINDQIIASTDPAGQKTQTTFNVRNQPVETIYPDGSNETIMYALDGTVSAKIDRKGQITGFKKDDLGRIIVREEHSSKGRLTRQSHYEYQGSRIVTAKIGSATTRFEHDGAGREVAMNIEANGKSKRTELDYDSCGQKIGSREWFGHGSHDFVAKIEELDCRQNKKATRIEKADGEIQLHHEYTMPEEFSFTQEHTHKNDLGQYVKLEEHINAKGMRELKVYDALQRLVSTIKLNSLGEKIGEYYIRYNANGKKTSEKHIVHGGKQKGIYEIRWTYDLLNRLTSIAEDSGSTGQKITSYLYNSHGQPETIIKPDDTALQRLYYDDGSLASFSANDNSFHYEYFYDDQLRLIEVKDLINHITQTRRYNDFGELIEENLGSAMTTIGNEYDLAGRKIALTLPDRSQILYHYDGALLSSVERKGTRQYKNNYIYEKSSGRLIASELPGGLGLLTRSYNRQGKFLSMESPWWSESVQEYDLEGHISAVTIQDPKDQTDYRYTYSDDCRLIEEAGHIHKKYHYDSLLNRLADDQQDWEYNGFNQLIKNPQTDFNYDHNGNLTKKKSANGRFTFYYDALNRLVKAVRDEQYAVQYTYDAFNRNIRESTYYKQNNKWKLNKTDHLLYDGDKEIGKVNEEGQITQLRVLGQGKGAEIGAAIALELDNRIYIPIHDHQGSVRCLVDIETRSVAEFYRYSTFGQEEIYDASCSLQKESPAGNPWRFSSKRFDDTTGLIAYGNRHYDPSMGRWTSPDPLFFYDTPNLYAYVKNDSVNHYDLYGHFSIDDTWNYAQAFFNWTYSYWAQVESLSSTNSFEKIGRYLLGDDFYNLSFHQNESSWGTVGEAEISEKVRISYVNGILTSNSSMSSNLNIISQMHGGNKIHYVFRATKGWSEDILHCVYIKGLFSFGYRSPYTDLIVQTWRKLIDEMGGVNGGGTIIHYAHSLGGTETERARHLLTPEERNMIRVITFGSSSFIDKRNFQDAVNHVSRRDFVQIIEFLSGRDFYDTNLNLHFHSKINWLCMYQKKGFPIVDHFLSGDTYLPILENCGKEFLKEFAKQ